MRPSTIRVELIKLNPYDEITQAEFVASRRGQEFTAFHFTLDDDGEVIGIRDEREALIGAKSVHNLSGQGTAPANYNNWFGAEGDWNTDELGTQ